MSATDALAKLDHRKVIEEEVCTLIEEIPHTHILMSMPGIGTKTAAQILMTVGDFSDFKTAAHMASYAGLCPQTNQSGHIHQYEITEQGGKQEIKERPMAILIFSDQIPRAFTPTLRAQT